MLCFCFSFYGIGRNYYNIPCAVSLQPVTEGGGVMLTSESDDIILTPLYLNQSYLLYGASAALTVRDYSMVPNHEYSENDTENEALMNFTETLIFTRFNNLSNHTHTELESCVLFFLGANAEIVLTSNIIKYVEH